MVDVVDRATRSRMMSGIRGRDTTPEVIVRKYLFSHGFRYRIAPKSLPGKPDIVLSKYRTAIFVHGCFWHRHPGCKYTTHPATNRAFWREKFRENVRRDRKVQRLLEKAGWRVITLWACDLSPAVLAKAKKKISAR